jgi:hypothetical protein
MTLAAALSAPLAAVDYTVTLAAYDAVPVVLFVIAYLVIGFMLAEQDRDRSRLAVVGAVLAGIGGMAKVAWKFILAFNGQDIAVLDAMLFPLVGTGLLLVAGSIRPRWSVRGTVIIVGVMVTLAGVLSWTVAPRVGQLVMLAVMTIATVLIALRLFTVARQAGRPEAASLALVSLVVAFLMAGLARLDQSTAQQWAAEVTNTVGQGALLACVLLLRATGVNLVRRHPGAPSTVDLSSEASVPSMEQRST